jgi:hypothetical protein
VIRLLICVLLVCPLFSFPAETPEAVVRFYFDGIASDLPGVARRMHPEALARFRELLLPFLEDSAQTGDARQLAEKLRSMEALRKSSPQDFFTEMMTFFLDRPEIRDGMKNRQISVLGHVADDPMAHVVYRVNSGPEGAPGKMKVITVRKESGEWKLFLPDDLEIALQTLRLSGKQEPRRDVETAGTEVQKPYELNEVYKGLRDIAFSSKAQPSADSLALNQPYGVIVEIGHPKGAVTVFALRDGTASVYFSTGGGSIGGQGREEIRSAAIRLVERAATLVSKMQVAPDNEVVSRGRVRAWVLLRDRVLMDETRLDSPERGPALDLFDFARDILNGFRRLEQKR